MTSTTPGTTQRLAEFVVGLRYEAIPPEVIARVKRQCLDLFGVALAGFTEPAAAAARRFVERQRSTPESSVWGSAMRASAADSAFANGIAAHALDYDDMWLPSVHPTAPTLPATLAVGESLAASGHDLLVAQLAAYEVMGKLSLAVSGRAGWHPTAIFGTLGATTACAKLLGLDARQTAMAWGIASSEASGVEGHSGTMTKPFHAGQAARSGVVAALLAADGFTANEHVFDGGHGFFSAFYRDLPYDPEKVTASLGDPYHIMSPGVGIKMYPAGYFMHQAFEAALELAQTHDLHLNDVREVEIGLRHERNFNRPVIRSGLEGKFSLQYMAAMALLDRRLTIESFEDAHALSAPVQEMLRRIRTHVDPTIPHDLDVTYNPVTVRLVDGREYTAHQDLPRSHWRYPLPREEWLEKYRANAGRVLAPQRVERLRECVEQLETVADVREVGGLLGTDRAERTAAEPERDRTGT
jgi:2-methylcitrate dehydratase PrpD